MFLYTTTINYYSSSSPGFESKAVSIETDLFFMLGLFPVKRFFTFRANSLGLFKPLPPDVLVSLCWEWCTGASVKCKCGFIKCQSLKVRKTTFYHHLVLISNITIVTWREIFLRLIYLREIIIIILGVAVFFLTSLARDLRC